MGSLLSCWNSTWIYSLEQTDKYWHYCLALRHSKIKALRVHICTNAIDMVVNLA